MLSANVGFDLVAASVLCDLGSELCLVVLSLTPKVSFGFGLCEALCLGWLCWQGPPDWRWAFPLPLRVTL